MASNQSTEFTAAPTWLAMAKQDGYYLKPAIITTLIMGMYLHVTSLFIGRELLVRYILTPSFDAVLAVPMTYAGIVGWLMWRNDRVEGPLDRVGTPPRRASTIKIASHA